MINSVSQNDYPELITVWEDSVRATHDFLTEQDIVFLKPLILEQYFDAVDLRCIKDDSGKILGFIGVAQANIEMLFISPDQRGQGIGSLLIRYAIDHQGATKVDVNEQNPQAVGFYQHMGFNQTGRSPVDGQGKPYPILHMALSHPE
jgi:putative acetyltransferase